MINLYYKNIHNKSLQPLTKARKGSWINVIDPSDEEIGELVAKYGLDDSLIIDALDPHEMPRIEVSDKKLYIFTRYAFETRKKFISTYPVLIVKDEDYIYTVCKDICPYTESFAQNLYNFTTTQKTKFLLQIIGAINEGYGMYLTKLNRQIKAVSTKLEKITNEDIAKFVEFEKTLNDFISALIPANLIFERIMNQRYLKLYEEDEDLIIDLSLSNSQIIEITKGAIRNIINIREAYTTIISNNLNKTMKALTSITVILTIPTMIYSFFGMNIPLPFERNPLGFVVITLSTITISLLLALIFRWKKLL